MVSRKLEALMWGTSHVELNSGYILRASHWVSVDASHVGQVGRQTSQHVLRKCLQRGPQAPNLISTAGAANREEEPTSTSGPQLSVQSQTRPLARLTSYFGPIVSYQIPLACSD